jgi:hypothetical protein
MRRVPRLLGWGITLLLVATACSGDDAEDTTTTTLEGSGTVTSLAASSGRTTSGAGGSGTTEAADAATTTTEPPGLPPVPVYEIVSRQPGESGDTVVIVLDPTSYSSLSDVDLENIIAEVYDDAAPVFVAHVVDLLEAAELVLLDSLTDEQREVLDEHYLARLVDGFRIVFEGPFSDFEDSILGS